MRSHIWPVVRDTQSQYCTEKPYLLDNFDRGIRFELEENDMENTHRVNFDEVVI